MPLADDLRDDPARDRIRFDTASTLFVDAGAGSGKTRSLISRVQQLVVEDGDLWWNRAVEAGCTVVMPFEKMFWGDRWGLLADPFGLVWAIDEPAART